MKKIESRTHVFVTVKVLNTDGKRAYADQEFSLDKRLPAELLSLFAEEIVQKAREFAEKK